MKNTFTVMLMVLATLVWGLAANAQTESVLFSFSSLRTGGTAPISGLTFDAAGNLYGTTLTGGAYGGGTVFEVTP